MIGARGAQMLHATLPYVEHWNGWHAWNGNTVAGYRPWHQLIDDTCRDVGRDPKTVIRSMAALVHLPDSDGVHDPRSTPISGTPEQIAETLLALHAEGVDHVQIVLSPNTCGAIEQFAPVIELVNRG
jgi:alkanesulfonate monooxygenase SsuD/methylene tetrahydromethanopterin reductase-like flavin-dependent oxidoreductase (luciferase family)